MIYKKEVFQADKKTNPLIGIVLFLISVLLFVVTVPLGFLYGLFHKLATKGIVGMGEFFLKMAISIDQLGNVAMQHLLNVLWIKKSGYKFGNRDETISSALGRNKKLGTLTAFGKLIDRFLDLIDKDHSLNSIDYYIEPSPEILEMVAWAHLQDQKILAIRRQGEQTYSVPWALKEPGTPDALVLFKALKEVFKIDLDIPSLQYINTFEASNPSQGPQVLNRKTVYTATFQGQLTVDANIFEMEWLAYADRAKMSEVDQLLLDFLKDAKQLL